MDKLLLYVFGPLAFAASLLVIATGIRRAIDRYRSRLTPEQLKEKYEAYLQRLRNPQAEAVERELGKLLPSRLLRLYKDQDAVRAAGFQVEAPVQDGSSAKAWHVYCFEPLDLESLNESPYEEELGAGFCFATRGRNSWYWVAASEERKEDSPVIFLDYDSDAEHGQMVAASLEEFLKWPRLQAQ